MSVTVVTLSSDEARSLTEEVKRDAAALWAKLLRLYEGGAHTALGYSSWADYWQAEFGRSDADAYRVLQAARVMEQLPMGSSRPASERVARELTPVLRDDPAHVADVWSEAVERQAEQPTAAEVREVVDETRGKMAVHYSSETDVWATPQDLFDTLNAEFSFETDVCALPENAKCVRYFTPEDDGLAQEWTGTCWMNPPYGAAIRDWVAKAHAAGQSGATVVALVPARVETNWWWDHCRYGEIRFIRGRLKFGGAETSAPFPSAVVVFGRPATVKHWEWR